MIYTVTLNPAIDYVAQLDKTLQPGTLNRNCGEAVQYGGKGINVSGVLNALDVDNIALGFVAGFTGKGLEDGLRQMGIRTDFVHLPQGLTRINVKVKADLETEINGMGPLITDADLDKLFAQLDRLRAGDILVLSGSIPSCLPADTYAQIMKRMENRGVFVVVDAAGQQLLNVLPLRPFLIKPNHHELAELFGLEAVDETSVDSLAVKLQEMGAQNVLISMAEDGALLLDTQGNTRRIHCPKGTVVNSVGAGDSMVAGFLAGYVQTKDYDYALKLGVASGSATAFSMGLANEEEIMKLLAQL